MKEALHNLAGAKRPLLIIISGPSGVGKDAVLTRMKELGFPLEYITTVTTRPKRATERENVDYRFESAERFQEMVAGGEFLEWAHVYGNWYGVPKDTVKQALGRGRDAIVKVDVQGAATIKGLAPEALFILRAPPSLEELAARLRQRHTESPFDLSLRIDTAEKEMGQISLFDYMVVNRQGAIDQAVSEIEAILTAEKCRVAPRQVALD